MKNRIKWFLNGVSHDITVWITYKFGKELPMYTVAGFPRSGSSWLSEVVADYFNLPRPRHIYLPIAFSCVFHTHFNPSKRAKNVFFIIRDGRDSYASYYHKIIRMIKNNELITASFYEKLFEGAEDEKEQFYRFLKDELSKKKMWGSYNKSWLKLNKTSNEVAIIRYEELKNDLPLELAKALRSKDEYIDDDLLKSLELKHDFNTQKNRPENQHRTFLRKGILGDWKNIFNAKSAELFDEKCGKILIDLKYENNNNWVKEIE